MGNAKDKNKAYTRKKQFQQVFEHIEIIPASI